MLCSRSSPGFNALRHAIRASYYLALVVLVFSHGSVEARDLHASLSIIPNHSEYDENGVPSGGFVDLVKAMDEVYTGGTIKISLHPVARSIRNVEAGAADFHLPLIRVPHVSDASLNYEYVKKPITNVTFVLYTLVDQPKLDKSLLGNYNIETIQGHEQFFPFEIHEINSIPMGLKRLSRGRTHGFIVEQDAADSIIKQTGLKNIRRSLYQEFNSCIIVKKSENSAELASLLESLLNELSKRDKLERIAKSIHQPYADWQPFDGSH